MIQYYITIYIEHILEIVEIVVESVWLFTLFRLYARFKVLPGDGWVLKTYVARLVKISFEFKLRKDCKTLTLRVQIEIVEKVGTAL